MIRPFTCLCLLLAAGAGLYTYQAKHQAELIDREIARVLKLADAARQRTGVLRAEYALLNDPQRLAELAASHLPELRSTAPGQFTTLAELGRRLPPIGPAPMPPPLAEPAPLAPVAAAAGPVIASAARPAAAPTAIRTGPPSAAKTAPAEPANRLVAVALVPPSPPNAAAGPVRAPSLVASARKPAAAKPVAVASAAPRPARPDPFVTAVSAPAEALARIAAKPASEARAGPAIGTVSALGMARALITPASLPSR